MAGTYFQTPSIIDAIKGIWPWFWGISKFLWPLWIFVIILAIFKYIVYYKKRVNSFRSKSIQNSQTKL